MKILSVILAHDKRLNTLLSTYNSAKKVEKINNIEIYCFSTEQKTVEFAKENNIKVNIFERPEADRAQLTCSFWNIATGMRESELMQLSWLRNQVLERAQQRNYDYVFYIDADILMPKDTLKRLLALKKDMASGWYFHKRLPIPAINYFEYTPERIDSDMQNKIVVRGKNSGNGGVLFNRRIIENVRYNLYNGTRAEDTVFFEKANNAGFELYIDLGLYYEHLGDDFSPKAKKYKKEKMKIWNV